MRGTPLVLVFLIAVFTANAQVNRTPVIGDRVTIGVDGGVILPSSQFTASNFATISNTSKIGAYPIDGYHYDAYLGVKFSHVFGIMAQYGENTGFVSAEYFAGPYLSVKVLKIRLEAKVLAGLITSNYATFSTNTGTGYILDAYQNGSGFGYCAGAKIKYTLFGGVLGIGAGLNYLSSDIKYAGWTQTISSENVTQALSNGSVKMSSGLVQATIGLSIDI